MFLHKKQSGFTLAELLIALLILGEIATFTIPKVLTASQQQQKIATFKETISTFAGLAYMANLQSDTTYFPNKLNAVKVCNSNANTQGCWSHTNNANTGEGNEPGFVLHNGATVAGFNGYTGSNGIIVDWNGPLGPNIRGDDQIYLYICFDQGNGCWSYKAGQIIGVDPIDDTLYQSIFR